MKPFSFLYVSKSPFWWHLRSVGKYRLLPKLLDILKSLRKAENFWVHLDTISSRKTELKFYSITWEVRQLDFIKRSIRALSFVCKGDSVFVCSDTTFRMLFVTFIAPFFNFRANAEKGFNTIQGDVSKSICENYISSILKWIFNEWKVEETTNRLPWIC